LVQDALASRPDLRAAEIAVEVAGEIAGLAEIEIYTLTGMFDANSIGSRNMFESGPGTELPIPIFDRNQAGIARANTQLQRAAIRYVAVRNQIALEVRQAFARYQQARQGIHVWREKMMKPLLKTIDQANKAYGAGETSLLPVLDANWNLFIARRREAESVAGLRRAIAELERSLGGRLDLIPAKKRGEISE
ncbi:MAG: TolC family protein, partial [Methylococcaceae bacterium]|nr:TolC family protein [Methylococcaceae bacterium]